MRLRKLAILLIAITIFLTACANTAQQEEQTRLESAPFEITLERVSEALGQPERIGVATRYGAYAGTDEEQFAALSKLLAEFDLSTFSPVDAEEINEVSGSSYAALLIDQGKRSFALEIMDSIEKDECFIEMRSYISLDLPAEVYQQQIMELMALPPEEKSLTLKGSCESEVLERFEHLRQEIVRDTSDPANCAEVTVLAETGLPGLSGQDTYILNKGKSSVIRYYLDRGVVADQKEPLPEAKYDLQFKFAGRIYLFDSSTGVFSIDEGLYIIDTPLEHFLRNIVP